MAIMPVHLYGQMADMDGSAASSARDRGLAIVEDAARRTAPMRDGRRAGAAGTAAAFSFYPGKNLGAMGDAGALVTNDAEVAARVRALREHGQTRKYHHDEIGWTARLDTIQAAVLAAEAAAISTAGTTSAATSPRCICERSTASATSCCRRSPTGSAPGLASVRGPHRPSPERLGTPPPRARHRHRAALPGAAAL